MIMSGIETNACRRWRWFDRNVAIVVNGLPAFDKCARMSNQMPLLFTPLALREKSRAIASWFADGTSSAEDDGLARPWHLRISANSPSAAPESYSPNRRWSIRVAALPTPISALVGAPRRRTAPVAEFIRPQGALAGIQIAHAGRAGRIAEAMGWQGAAYRSGCAARRATVPIWGRASSRLVRDVKPIPMSIDMIKEVQNARAAELADRGVRRPRHPRRARLFDSLVPVAHANHRNAYGGDFNDLRFALEIAERVRSLAGAQALFFRVSVIDALKRAGAWRTPSRCCR